jgi:hypothetical protein
MKTEKTAPENLQIPLNNLIASLDLLTAKELRILQKEVSTRLKQKIDDLLDKNCLESARRQVEEARRQGLLPTSIEEVRAIWGKFDGSLSAEIIAERGERG